MEYVELGTTGQEVSAVGLGCMSLNRETADRGKAAVTRAFELGITLFDTADVYGRGQSEEILGEALREGKIDREQVVIASKCGIVFQGMVEGYIYKAYDLSPAYLKW
ncbi:aldo/keto reductase [Candidatus Poribacteria bacterium]|nr:aldo/keto reductase [Candidatus Poribacteria bacterium]